MLGFDDELPQTQDYSHALIRFLQHGNALGEAILERMPHPMAVFNENLKVVRSNMQFKKLFKKDSEHVNGFLLRDISSEFTELTLEHLKKDPASLDMTVGTWQTKSLFHMDNKYYYLLYK